MKIETGKIENSFGTYVRGTPMSLPIPELGPIIDGYKKKGPQRLFARRFEKLPKFRGETFYASVKIDGEFAAYYFNKAKKANFFCNSPTKRVYMGLPVNDDLNKIMETHGIKSALIGGELFATPHDPLDFEARTRVYDFTHYSRGPESQEDLERIGFKAFDIIQINQVDWLEKPFQKRFKKLYEFYDYQKINTLYRFNFKNYDFKIMSKAISSYYDWELGLKSNSENDQKLNDEKINSFGISESNFKEFMKKWKEKNLS